MACWGRLERQHVTDLAHALGGDSDREQYRSPIDLRRVESIDPSAFDLLSDYLRGQAQVLREPALALIRPKGFDGVAIAGLCKVYDLSNSVEVFTDPCDALTWLGATNALHVIAELDSLLCGFANTTAIVRALRAHLGKNPRMAALTTASAALGMSGRTLQRKLQEAHTSFQTEHNFVQVEFAKHLLRDTNHEIKRIAFDVGCSSLAAFSVLFRRIEGHSPSAWRSHVARVRQSLG